MTFTVTGVGSSLTSSPLTQGSASVLFTVPGGSHAATYPLLASYGGDASFLISSDAHQTLTIAKAKPAINWNAPASINSGLPLGAGQLNATANVPGNFTYTPPAGERTPIGFWRIAHSEFRPDGCNGLHRGHRDGYDLRGEVAR